MKKVLALLLACVMLICLAPAFADMPYFKLEDDIIYIDLDSDGELEGVELYCETDPEGVGTLGLKLIRGGVVGADIKLCGYAVYDFMELESLINVYGSNFTGSPRLILEAHFAGSESVYSYWMILHYAYGLIFVDALCYDPGFSSGVGLYSSCSLDDPQQLLIYSADYGSFAKNSYITALTNAFGASGVMFSFKPLPFTGAPEAARIAGINEGGLMLTMNATAELADEYLEPQTADGGDTSDYSSGSVKLTATGNVNVRTDAGKDYKSRGTLKKGATAPYLNVSKVDERGTAWHKISFNGKEGWVSSKYSSLGVIDKVTPKTVIGTVKATGDVNVRTQANKDAKIVTTLKKGSSLPFAREIRLDDRGVVWFKVYTGTGSNTGWVSSKYSTLK
ncbi:MAG: SH3 domain-containing protein [Clostridiales bacterium]|nr:SH3 domain-containing protein [Clostridiales bacterium]